MAHPFPDAMGVRLNLTPAGILDANQAFAAREMNEKLLIFNCL
jgi:hypothetical protein